jgi:hypothetical protein
MSNWSLLLVNVILLSVNTVFLAFSAGSSYPEPSTQALKEAAHLDMDVGYSERPLSLYVNKDFPRKNTFALYDSDQRLYMASENVEKNDHWGATRSAQIMLGVADLSMDIYYSVGERVRVHELVLSKRDEFLFDMNADGFYDTRVEPPKSGDPSWRPAEIQVWYHDKWQDVTREGEWSNVRKHLPSGEIVEFDRQRGVWRSAQDKAAPDNPANSSGD